MSKTTIGCFPFPISLSLCRTSSCCWRFCLRTMICWQIHQLAGIYVSDLQTKWRFIHCLLVRVGASISHINSHWKQISDICNILTQTYLLQCDGETGQLADCERYCLPSRDAVQFVRQVTTLWREVDMSTKLQRSDIATNLSLINFNHSDPNRDKSIFLRNQ